MAADMGADVVEINAAHDCIPQWFLSPRTNKRSDVYGGSREGRLRIVREIVALDPRPTSRGRPRWVFA